MTYNTLANLVPAYFFLSGLAFCQVAWPWVIQHRKWLIPIWGLDASKVESVKGRSEGWNPSEGLPCSAAGMGESLGSLKPYLFTYSLTREFWGNVMWSRRQSYRKGWRWTLNLSPQVLEAELVETVQETWMPEQHSSGIPGTQANQFRASEFYSMYPCIHDLADELHLICTPQGHLLIPMCYPDIFFNIFNASQCHISLTESWSLEFY